MQALQASRAEAQEARQRAAAVEREHAMGVSESRVSHG